jgi:hypothetical protein
MRKLAALCVVLALFAGPLACGKYGKPVRASEKRQQQEAPPPAPTEPEGASLGSGDEMTEETVQ